MNAYDKTLYLASYNSRGSQVIRLFVYQASLQPPIPHVRRHGSDKLSNQERLGARFAAIAKVGLGITPCGFKVELAL
jgi:hypothetical protein